MTGALSPTHWAIIAVVVLLVFGSKRLPDAARGLGQSLRIFKAETATLTEAGPDSGAGDRDAGAKVAEPEKTAATGASGSGANPDR